MRLSWGLVLILAYGRVVMAKGDEDSPPPTCSHGALEGLAGATLPLRDRRGRRRPGSSLAGLLSWVQTTRHGSLDRGAPPRRLPDVVRRPPALSRREAARADAAVRHTPPQTARARRRPPPATSLARLESRGDGCETEVVEAVARPEAGVLDAS